MSFNAHVKAHLSRKQTLYEGRREREFYRYFEAVRTLSPSGPKLCDLFDENAVRAHEPVSSPDRALTAFCQLGALRLGTRRAMLFFFDSNFAYVLAEATRSLSLQDDSVHEIEDGLWLGHSIIPRGFSVCEETVCRAVPSDPSDPDYEESLIHIINNFEEDTKFCDRPYVQDGPKARFYAGVPITTPKGIKIGAYCCLDDKPRNGISQKDKEFLQDMAATVMTHLETVRAKSEHERGSHMVTGLGAFVEGATSLHEWAEQGIDRNHRKTRISPKFSNQSASPVSTLSFTSPSDATPDSNGHSLRSQSLLLGGNPRGLTGSTASPERPQSRVDPSNDDDTLTSFATTILEPTTTTTVSRHAESLHHRIVASEVTTTLQRAARIVREAMDVDGTMFLDANVGAYEGLTNRQTPSGSDQTSSSEAVASGAEMTAAGDEGQHLPMTLSARLCYVHASSHTTDSQYGIGAEKRNPIHAPGISERFLRRLLLRYPRGKIWNFNGDGNASSDDDSSGETATEADGVNPTTVPGLPSPAGETTRKKSGRSSRIDDSREIQRLFPGARSLALVGMWDQKRERWFSACILWTYKPLRLFSADLEVNYLSAFCDVIMAEIHRLEAQKSDKAKSDFISSISHELRSPLHGILGSVECLQDQPTKSQSVSLVSQIDVCGRTLVDIVDHILEYTKINHHTKAMNDNTNSRRIRSLDPSRRARLGDMMSLDTVVSLDEVTEEVVQTTAYSFACSRSKQLILDRKVSTILDIEQSTDLDLWKCHMPLGAWKRICINLVSNALKYTDGGSIQVSLNAATIPGKRKRFNAILTVKDTGRGMSQEFLENHLFKAFSQEDTLVEGTGLGMSLVAKIVRALGGSIEVQSEKWVGTTITVSLPVDRQSKQDQGNKFVEMAAPTSIKGTTIGILDFPKLDESSVQPLLPCRDLVVESLERTCTQLGLQTIYANDQSLKAGFDVGLMTEVDFQIYQQHSPSTIPVIVLCSSAISERQLRASTRNYAPRGYLEYVAQPCGPQSLAAAVRNCLEQKSNPATSPLNSTQVLDQSVDPAAFEIPHVREPGLKTERTPAALAHFPMRDKKNDRGNSRPANSVTGGSFSLRSLSTGDVLNSPNVITPMVITPMVKNVVDTQAPTKTAAEQVKSLPPALSLLLVDDNHINLMLLVNYAKKRGHHNVTAGDGQQAIDAYKSAWQPHLNIKKSLSIGAASSQLLLEPTPPQVVLMDINMPVLNGFEATRAIRSFEEQNRLPPAHIIALTGLGGVEAQQEAFSSGVDLFLTKPVRLKELTKILEDIKKRSEEDGQSSGSSSEG